MKKAFRILLIIVLIFSLAILPANSFSLLGSRGEEVRSIQTYLKNNGYYNGNIDGIYGEQTKAAVTAFQKDNGLDADGIAGNKTLSAMGITQSILHTDSDYMLLARVISAEARGEPYMGQVAVGAVILNRIEHPSFPDSLSAVVYQNGAFSCMYDGQINEAVAQSAYSAATDALNGLDPTGGAIYYYNPKTATNKWIRSRPVVYTVGQHVFCY